MTAYLPEGYARRSAKSVGNQALNAAGSLGSAERLVRSLFLLRVIALLIAGISVQSCGYFSQEEIAIRKIEGLADDGKAEIAKSELKQYLGTLTEPPTDALLKSYVETLANKEDCLEGVSLFAPSYGLAAGEALPMLFQEMASHCWKSLSDQTIRAYQRKEIEEFLSVISQLQELLALLPRQMLVDEEFYPNEILAKPEEVLWLSERHTEIAKRLLALELLRYRLGYPMGLRNEDLNALSSDAAYQLANRSAEDGSLVDFIPGWNVSMLIAKTNISRAYERTEVNALLADSKEYTLGWGYALRICLDEIVNGSGGALGKITANDVARETLHYNAQNCGSGIFGAGMVPGEIEFSLATFRRLEELDGKCRENPYCALAFDQGLFGADISSWLSGQFSKFLTSGELTVDFAQNLEAGRFEAALGTGEWLARMIERFGDELIGAARERAGEVLFLQAKATFETEDPEPSIADIEKRISYLTKAKKLLSGDQLGVALGLIALSQEELRLAKIESGNNDVEAMIQSAKDALEENREEDAVFYLQEAVALSEAPGVSEENKFLARAGLAKILYLGGSKQQQKEGLAQLRAIVEEFPDATTNGVLFSTFIAEHEAKRERAALSHRAADAFDNEQWVSAEALFLEVAKFAEANKELLDLENEADLISEYYFNAGLAALGGSRYGRARSHFAKAALLSDIYKTERDIYLERIRSACPNRFLGC